MPSAFKAAVAQMTSTEDKAANLARATQLVREAAAAGAQLIALPEMFNCLGHFDAVIAQAEPIPGPTSESFSALAKELGVTILAGSIAERVEGEQKAYNTSLLFGPDGRQLAAYRKIHLFDVNLPGKVRYEESRWLQPGLDIVTLPTPLAHLGQSICYDLRFPELFRAMSAGGMEVLLLPAAFTHATGQAHWEVLLRARAIENQVFLIAPNQCGHHPGDLHTFGHSAIIDPWGEVLATMGEEEGIAVAEIDLARLRDVRHRLPALGHRVIAG